MEDERVSSLKDQVGLPCPLCMSLSSNLLCPRKCHARQNRFLTISTVFPWNLELSFM
jgi:hypothetical protein